MSLEEHAQKLASTPANLNAYAGSIRVGRKAKLGPPYEMIDLQVERFYRDNEDMTKMIRETLQGIDGIINAYVSNLPLYLKPAKNAPTIEVKR
jgi:hypothetical protein